MSTATDAQCARRGAASSSPDAGQRSPETLGRDGPPTADPHAMTDRVRDEGEGGGVVRAEPDD